eukprot:GILI01013987.1.p1 GENE.GILI01013987.1~~GILI01013987.1.p1  ORF type:complete len:763 (-),score=91.11 GILI01013987.1:137-2425(-)
MADVTKKVAALQQEIDNNEAQGEVAEEDKGVLPTEQLMLVPAKSYSWSNLLSQPDSAGGLKDRMIAPFGTRPETDRKPFEYHALDGVQLLPVSGGDVEFVLALLSLMISEPTTEIAVEDIPKIVNDDLEMVFITASAICRRFLLKYVPNSPDLGIEAITLRIIQLARATVDVNRSADAHASPMLHFLLRSLMEFRNLGAKNVTRVLCDMTRMPTGPIDIKAEASRVHAIQLKNFSDNVFPKLDLDERAAAERLNFVRKCPPLWHADQERYLGTLIDHLPKIMSVPHPLSSFAIRPLNPIISLGNHFTCDLCYVPHIRASYQAVQEANGTTQSRNLLELVQNCIGFDLCVRCAAQYFNESLVAVADAVQWEDAQLYTIPASDDNDEAAKGSNTVSHASSKPRNQITLSSDSSSFQVTTPVVPSPSSPVRATFPVRLQLVASGLRPTIDINNQLRLSETAQVRAHLGTGGPNTTGGTLLISCAVAPMGARPIARKWKSEYSNILAKRVSSVAPKPSSTSDDVTTSFRRLHALTTALKPYFTNASRCTAKRRMAPEEQSLHEESQNAGDDDEENTCPICLDLLYPRLATNDTLSAKDDVDKDFTFAAALSASKDTSNDDDITSSALVRATVQTTCRHWFHAQCIDAFFASKKATQCPLCRANNCLNTLTAQRFNAKSPDDEPEDDMLGEERERTVTPEMIANEASQNLTQNVYQLRIPLQHDEVQSLLNGTGTLRVIVGTLVSLDGQYHNPTDLGCLAQFEVCGL